MKLKASNMTDTYKPKIKYVMMQGINCVNIYKKVVYLNGKVEYHYECQSEDKASATRFIQTKEGKQSKNKSNRQDPLS